MTKALLRVGIVVLVSWQVAIGLWAALHAEGFFFGYPTRGLSWVSMFPPYNEHLVRDYGLTLLQLAPVALVCLKRLDRAVVAATLIGVLLFHVPHLLYHEAHIVRTDDLALQRLFLWTPVVVAVGLLCLTRKLAKSLRPAVAEHPTLRPP